MNDNTKSNSDITNVVLPKKLHEYDEPHRGDTSNFVIENDDRKEEYNSNQMFEVQVDQGAECCTSIISAPMLSVPGLPEISSSWMAGLVQLLLKSNVLGSLVEDYAACLELQSEECQIIEDCCEDLSVLIL
ncbi:hypothetical protein T459_25233 [Capsicum annuum]|uniref:Uncharacterized protein n=1 Tax=Capsicum annuum TaxID=4072 RepID=A0A2G2YK75_CAPAN|nr:hypothetical protein T459_25233 [Capsicum annuum]